MELVNICSNCQLIFVSDRGYVIFDYETPVLAIDCRSGIPNLKRLWGGWSLTTQRHINRAFAYLGLKRINKATWEKMEVESCKL